MNRAARRARGPQCVAEVAFTDFDGSNASMPCGARATHELLLLERTVWSPSVRRMATRVRACQEHAAEPLDPQYGGEGVIRRPL